MSEMMYCDNTLLKAVATCSTKALVRHHLGYTAPGEGVRLKAGSAMHEALAVYMEDTTQEGALRALVTLEAAYAEWAEEHVLEARDAAYTYKNVAAVLARWLEMHPAHALPWATYEGSLGTEAVKAVEVPFEVPLTPDVTMTGRFDALVRKDGELYVLDHKTTGSIDERFRRQFLMSSQLSGYVWAAEAVTGERVRGVIINAVEIARLPSDPKRTCKTHAVKYAECGLEHARSEILTVDRSEAQVATWYANARRLAWQWGTLLQEPVVEEAPMEGTFTNACAYCEFQEWCSVGRPAESLDKLYVIERWDPRGV